MDPFDVLKFCPKCGKSAWENKHANMRVCRSCGYEMYKNPTIGGAALIFDQQDRLLAVRRAKEPAKGTLHLPGGFCEAGECIEDAVKREVREETNLEISLGKYLFSIPNHYEYKGVELYPLDFFFEAKIKDTERLLPDKSENSEILFIPRREINIDAFGLESVKAALRRYLGR